MLDPMTAIGLASSIIAFVDFGTKLVKGAIEIYDASDGTLEENRTCEAVTREMRQLAIQLEPPDYPGATGQERTLCRLAAQCHELSDRLLTLLGRIKPTDVTSKRQSLWAALENKYHEKERDDLSEELDRCREQLASQMNFETMISVKALSEYVCKNTESLALLNTHVSELSELNTDAWEAIQKLLDIQKAALQVAIGDRILQSLEFEDMHGRYDMVDEAHEKTFRWIFDEDGAAQGNELESLDDIAKLKQLDLTMYIEHSEKRREQEKTQEEINMRHEARETFLTWLSSGTGIFHISGKMGSGKSTLMKYLEDHPETRTRLSAWSGENELVFASFFFWRPGSKLQKSLSGLYRSLLHDVLASHPELIKSVLPDVWMQAKASPWIAQDSLLVRENDIRQGFKRLVSTESLCAKHCFCFFIDGLDEYESSTQHDSIDLVKQLHSWTAAFPSKVKLCVSSREYNVFMKELSSSPRLRLHTLTKYDIHAYVMDRLAHIDDEWGRTNLTDKIVEKAGGIFFWVALVVRSVREQLENSVELPHLEGYINELPDELEDLYRHIIDTLDKNSRKRLFQTISMLPLGFPLDLLAYSFLDRFDEDPEFAERDTFKTTLDKVREDEQKQINIGRDKMTGWCRGFIETDYSDILHYAHRSVADFMETNADVQNQMRTVIKVHPLSIVSELLLARIALHEIIVPHLQEFDLVRQRQKCNLDHPPYSFLRCLDAIHENKWSTIDDTSIRGNINCLLGGGGRQSMTWVWQRGFRGKGGLDLTFSPYFFPHIPLSEYTIWKIINDPTTTNMTSKAVLLFYAALDESLDHPVLDTLLERSIITPATRTHLMPFIMSVYSEKYWEECHSIWQLFLIRYFYVWLQNLQYSLIESFAAVAQRLLRYGADPRFRFTTPPQKGLELFKDTFYFGDPSNPEIVILGREYSIETQHKIFESMHASSETEAMAFDPATQQIDISLRDWIQLLDDFSGKEALLQLVDDRLHELESAEVALNAPQETQPQARPMKLLAMASSPIKSISLSHILATVFLLISLALGYSQLQDKIRPNT